MSATIELAAALVDVQRIAREYGDLVAVFPRGEAGVVRGPLNGIAQYTQAGAVAIYAFPVQHDPTERELDRVGLVERVPVLIWTPLKEWTDLGLGFDSISELHATVVLDGKEYRVRNKALANKFLSASLQIVLALEKR